MIDTDKLWAEIFPLLVIIGVSFSISMYKRFTRTRGKKHFIPLTGTVVGYKSEFAESVGAHRADLSRMIDVLSHDVKNGRLVEYYPIVRFRLDDQEHEAVVAPAQKRKPVINVPMAILVNLDNLQEAYSEAEQVKASLFISLIGWSAAVFVLCRVMLWFVRRNPEPFNF